MKRKLCLILSCILLLAAVIPTSVFASDVSLYNNNTMRNNTSFSITDSGEARVSYQYVGYEGITTGAEITIKIEKRNFLFFWTDVVEETIVIAGESYIGMYKYQLSKTGTYKCTVTYRVSGTGGADDGRGCCHQNRFSGACHL